MNRHTVRARLMSAAVFALTLALAAACSPITNGDAPASSASQSRGLYGAVSGGY